LGGREQGGGEEGRKREFKGGKENGEGKLLFEPDLFSEKMNDHWRGDSYKGKKKKKQGTRNAFLAIIFFQRKQSIQEKTHLVYFFDEKKRAVYTTGRVWVIPEKEKAKLGN